VEKVIFKISQSPLDEKGGIDLSLATFFVGGKDMTMSINNLK
jgi:hypothetical protein